MAKQAAAIAQAIGEYIDIGKLHASPTNPRKRFYADSLDELAASIANKGVIEPLIVRRGGEAYQIAKRNRDNALAVYRALENEINSKEYSKAHEAFARAEANDDGFEIVCGERRYRASQLAKLEQVPCIIRELTDDEVLDIQIHENLHREDVHPMDEAYGYQFLLDKLKCTVAEVAARVGKSEKFVLSRLKLNALIPEAQEDMENGHLLLTYAMEIAKFSGDVQKIILDNAAYERDSKYNSKKSEWEYFPIKERRANWGSFTNFINERILRLLSAAPFDRKSTNLRADGLACIACPERTGANVGLFDEGLVDKKDSCLNPGCFSAKKEQHVINVRQKIAHEASIEETAVPLLKLDSYATVDDKAYGKWGFTCVGKKPYKDFYGNVSDKTCDKSVTGVNISDGQYGKTYEVCLYDSGCTVHYAKAKSDSGKVSTAKQQEKELTQKRERREELVDVRVGNDVRCRVFRPAAEQFAATFSVSGVQASFLPYMIAKMWCSDSDDGSYMRNKVVKPIMAAIMDIDADKVNFEYRLAQSAIKIGELSEANQHKLLFLLVHGNLGAMYYDRYASQKPVRDLAAEYGIDYRLLDAEERLRWAEEKAKKHVPLFKAYLDAVRAGDSKAKIPRPYAETYKPRD